MVLPEFYLHEAHQADLDAERGRQIALRLESNGRDLGSRLQRTRTEFTSDVWDSAIARSRQRELSVHSRRLEFAEDDLRELVVELRVFADNRETDAVYFRQRYNAGLLEEAQLLEETVEPGGPS